MPAGLGTVTGGRGDVGRATRYPGAAGATARREEVLHVYPHQRDRLTEALERDGLAALVATSPANVLYVAGFQSPTAPTPRAPALAVFAPRGTALVVPAAELATVLVDAVAVDHVVAVGGVAARYTEPADDVVRRLRELAAAAAPTLADGLARALDALGVTAGRIGVDPGGVAPPAWEALRARFGERLVPAAEAFLGARRVKGPWEVECLERALGVVEEAVNAVLQTLEPGVTEREALTAWAGEVVKRGAAPLPSAIATGPRTWLPSPPATDRALRRGELVRFDVGAVLKGYCARLARTAVAGEPDARQAATWKAVESGLEAALAAVRPGATAARVHAAALEAVRAGGLADAALEHAGHGIGLEPAEAPSLAPGVDATLEMGEVVCVEVACFSYGWAGVAVRETVLVTRAGHRTLNRSVRGLVTLD